MNKNQRPLVVVTGAAGHLGRAVAATWAGGDDTLVLVDRDLALLRQAFGADTVEQRCVALDLLDGPACAAAVATLLAEGPVRALCHLAGGFAMGTPVHLSRDADWAGQSDLNLRTLLNIVRAVVPGMLAQGGGAIVTVGAAAALQGAALKGPYVAAKSALMRVTETLSDELRDQGIRVNGVLPSILDTPVNRQAMPDADPARWVAPQDLAQVIRFLASDAARALHGALLPVRGLS